MEKPAEDNVKKEEAPAMASTTTRNVLLGVGVVVLMAVAFGAGLEARDHHRRVTFGVAGGGPLSTMGPRGFGTGGRYGGQQTQNAIVLTGKITAVNGNDFTLDQNGSSKTVKTDSSTRFRGVGISGLKSGDQVSVAGTTNSDGSIQAASVSVGTVTTSDAPAGTPPVDTQSF